MRHLVGRVCRGLLNAGGRGRSPVTVPSAELRSVVGHGVSAVVPVLFTVRCETRRGGMSEAPEAGQASGRGRSPLGLAPDRKFILFRLEFCLGLGGFSTLGVARFATVCGLYITVSETSQELQGTSHSSGHHRRAARWYKLQPDPNPVRIRSSPGERRALKYRTTDSVVSRQCNRGRRAALPPQATLSSLKIAMCTSLETSNRKRPPPPARMNSCVRFLRPAPAL